MRHALIAAALAACVPAGAPAQNALGAINALNAAAPAPPKAELEPAILAKAKAIADAKKGCLPKAIDVEDVAPITAVAAIEASISSGKLRNAWSVYVHYAGCPGSEPYRYALLQLSDGSLRALLVNRGRSFANLSVMRDASTGASVTALSRIRKENADCEGRDMIMGTTRITSQSEDLGPELLGVRYAGSWTEAWDFTACGLTATVLVEFRADGEGGAYWTAKRDLGVVSSAPRAGADR
jgi:hypothetical protein